MATYFVNTYNTSGTYPYNSTGTAAKTFHELFEGLGGEFNDGDTIKVLKLMYRGVETPIVETDTSVINIAYKNRIEIIGCYASGEPLLLGPTATVIVDDESPLFKFYKCSNILIQGIRFSKSYSKNSITVLMDSCYKCDINYNIFSHSNIFSTTVVSNPPINLLIINSNAVTVYKNIIDVPSNDSPSITNSRAVGVYSVQSDNISIASNTFIVKSHLCTPLLAAVNNGLEVKNNTFYGMGNPNDKGGTGDSYFPVVDIQMCDVFDVYSNVIDGVTKGWCGFRVNNPSSNKLHQHIRNNVIVLNNEAGTCAITYNGSVFVDTHLVNNIITSRTLNTKSYGIDGRFVDGYSAVIDYNDFYNINRDMELRHYDSGTNAYYWISACGPYTARENPELLTMVNPSSYLSGTYSSYHTSGTSNVRGSGLDGTSMGIDGSTNYYAIEDSVFVNVRLTSLGINHWDTNNNSVAYFNSVFTQSRSAMNSYYNGMEKYTLNDAFYQNQFDFSCTYGSNAIPPFGYGDQFFGKSDEYVISNRRDLVPFEGISCPANPGRGFPTYPGYTTGLFGNPRATYANECGDLPCVIYDSVGDPRIIQDSMSSQVYLNNAIKPPCEG